MTITREDISNVMWYAQKNGEIDGKTITERNAQRRAKVEEFLEHLPDGPGLQGSQKSMILSDLHSYQEWEHE